MSQDRFLESGEPSPDDIRVPDISSPESRGLDLPAPEIDLGGGAIETSDKPLGPRRLALLREQMQQHAQELAEKQDEDPEHVDEDLAEKQRRMAALSSRAARASEEDRETAERAIAISQERSEDDSPVETTSIPADQVRRRALRAQREAGADDDAPAPSEPESEGPDIEGSDPKRSDPGATDAGATDAEGTDDEEPDAPEADPADVAGEAAGAPEEDPVQDPRQDEEPGKPVSALDAEGLELLDDKQYRESSGTRNIILLLVSLVVVALIIALIILL